MGQDKGKGMGILDLFRRRLTQENFAAQVRKQLSRTRPGWRGDYDKALFCLHVFDATGSRGMIHLHNAYADARKQPAARRSAVIARYLSAFLDSTAESTDKSPARLLPLIRLRAVFESTPLLHRVSGHAFDASLAVPYRRLSDDLAIGLGLDREHSIATVNRGQLEAWGMDFDTALAQAIANLRDRSTGSFEAVGHVLVSPWRDTYDASRLLLDDLLYRLPIKGDPVVAVPSRDVLLVTGSKDERGIEELIRMTMAVLADETRPLSERPLIWKDGQWAPYEMAAPWPEALIEVGHQRVLGLHQDQKEMLDKVHERDGIDLFVASYRVYRDDKTGRYASSAQWSRGVATLLPRTDDIWFYCDRSEEVLVVSWGDAETVLGRMQPEPELYPERFLITDFPTDEQLASLRSCASKVWTRPNASP